MIEPKKLIQTRLHRGMKPEERGNCYPAVIACIMGLDSAEDAIQIQEQYEHEVWYGILTQWVAMRGYVFYLLLGHQYDDSFYFVSGPSKRGVNHICIYKNGKLWHDPHPSGDGILIENEFECLKKVTDSFVGDIG